MSDQRWNESGEVVARAEDPESFREVAQQFFSSKEGKRFEELYDDADSANYRLLVTRVVNSGRDVSRSTLIQSSESGYKV